MSRTRNVLANWGGYLVAAGVNFILSPIIVHSLGDSAYGIWVLLGSLVGYLGLLDLGVRGAVTRYIAKFHAQKDHAESSRVASSALATFSALGIVAVLVSAGMAFFVDSLFEIPKELASAAQIVLFLGGVNMAISFVGGVFGGVVAGLQRFDYANAVEIGIGISRAIAIVIALREGAGLVSLALIQLAASTLRGLAAYVFSRRLYPELRVAFSECRRSHLVMIFSFSASVLLLQASGMLILLSDSIVIGASLPIGMVTFFAIAANLTEYARAPVSGISTALTPSVSALEAGDEADELNRVLLLGCRIATLIVLPIVLTFMIRGGSFIELWMGGEYRDQSGDVLLILSWALLFAVAYQVVVATMMGMSKHGGLVPAFMIEAACNIALSVVLLQSHGIVGVAWGTTIPRVIASVLFAPWYVRRVMEIPMRQFWFTVWVRTGAAMVPFALASGFIEARWPAENLLVYFAQIAAILPIAALGAWFLALDPHEKSRLLPPGFFMGLARRMKN